MQTRTTRFNGFMTLTVWAAVTLLAAAPRAAADEHIYGVITVRDDASFMMQTDADASLIVVLRETTKIRLSGKKVAAAELSPGLRVKVEGSYDGQKRLLADEITFKESDLRLARAIKAGLTATDQQVASNSANLQKGAVVLQQHAQALDTQGQALQQHQREIVQNDLKMVATTGAIGHRISDLDDYTVVDTLIVYFQNGRALVAPEYGEKLQAFAAKAKGIDAYRIQVKGYASAVGPRARNEALSLQRADAVTSVLQQRGAVPSANVFVPAAMGISEQFAANNTKQGQAENRRVIVTILQNKGISER